MVLPKISSSLIPTRNQDLPNEDYLKESLFAYLSRKIQFFFQTTYLFLRTDEAIIRADKVTVINGPTYNGPTYIYYNNASLEDKIIPIDIEKEGITYKAVEIPSQVSSLSKFYQIFEPKDSPYTHLAIMPHEKEKPVLLTSSQYRKWSVVYFPCHFLARNFPLIRAIFSVFLLGLLVKK